MFWLDVIKSALIYLNAVSGLILLVLSFLCSLPLSFTLCTFSMVSLVCVEFQNSFLSGILASCLLQFIIYVIIRVWVPKYSFHHYPALSKTFHEFLLPIGCLHLFSKAFMAFCILALSICFISPVNLPLFHFSRAPSKFHVSEANQIGPLLNYFQMLPNAACVFSLSCFG